MFKQWISGSESFFRERDGIEIYTCIKIYSWYYSAGDNVSCAQLTFFKTKVSYPKPTPIVRFLGNVRVQLQVPALLVTSNVLPSNYHLIIVHLKFLVYWSKSQQISKVYLSTHLTSPSYMVLFQVTNDEKGNLARAQFRLFFSKQISARGNVSK